MTTMKMTQVVSWLVYGLSPFLTACSVDPGLRITGAKGSSIGIQEGTSGTSIIEDCKVDGQVGCITTADFVAAKKAGIESKILPGETVAGVIGAAVTEVPNNCNADGVIGCVTVAAFKSADMSKMIPENLRSGITLAGISGSIANCSADGELGCITVQSFKAADMSKLTAANVRTGISIAGVLGAYPSPSNPLAANTVTPDLSSFEPTTPVGAYEFFDSAGNHYVAIVADGGTIVPGTSSQSLSAVGTMYRSVSVAGDSDLGPSNILSGTNIFGVSGSAVVAPANCSSNGSQSCVATGSYFASTKCAADGSDCFVPPYELTNQPLKAISYDAISTGKASIRSSLTISGIQGTLTDCSSNGTSGCVTTASFKSADLTNLSTENIKRGISIAGITGKFPSTESPLPRYSDSGASINTSGTDITDLTNFATQLSSEGTFEYWDSSGIRKTGSGDGDIIATNIKSGVNLENLSVIGSYNGSSNCSSDGQTDCVTTSTYKSVNTAALTAWDIRKGKTAGGIAGNLTFYKNMSNTTLYNRQSGSGSSTGIDIYDSIDDYNANGSFPTQTVSSWDQATGANWTQVVLNSTYKDQITGLVWLKDQGSGINWENAISLCEDSTSGSRTDWRLPTQKELFQAYVNGIWTQRSGLSLSDAFYWSATSVSYLSTQAAWFVHLIYGYSTDNGYKTGTNYRVICVAP